MHSHADSGWAMAIYAAVVALLLVIGVFRLDGVLARRKKGRGRQMPARRRFQDPDSRLMDPHGNGSSRGPAHARRRPRQRVIP
jgi:hypothetical protein